MSLHGAVGGTLFRFSHALAHALTAEEISQQSGVMQSLDPRVRVAGTALLVVAVTFAHRSTVLTGAFLLSVLLAVSSCVGLATLVKRVWLVVLAFTGVIALPALFLTPGQPVVTAGGTTLPITHQGLQSAMLLVLRVETAVTLTTTLVLSTAWVQVLKALRSFHLPREAVMMLALAHRYVFLLVETAGQMLQARQSRTVGVLAGSEQRRVMTRTAGVLLSKSMEVSEQVFLAMQARGYRGEVRILSEFRMRTRDWLGMAGFAGAAIALGWLGR